MKGVLPLLLVVFFLNGAFTATNEEDVVQNLKESDKLTITYVAYRCHERDLPKIVIYNKRNKWIGEFHNSYQKKKKVKLDVEDMHRLVVFERQVRNGETTGSACLEQYCESLHYELKLNDKDLGIMSDLNCNQKLFFELLVHLFELEEDEYYPMRFGRR